MNTTPLEKSILIHVQGRIVQYDNDTKGLPICIPEFRRSSGSYLKKRGLNMINAFVRKGVLEVVGSPWLPGFWIQKPEVLQSLVGSLNFKLPILLMGVSDKPVSQDNWTSFRAEPFMIVDNRWNSFQEYMDSMKTKYRSRLKKAARFREGYDVVELEHNEDNITRCAGMLEKTLTDKVAVLPIDLSELIIRFKVWFKEDYKIFGIQDKGELKGFISVVEDGECLRAMHYGTLKSNPDMMYSLAMFHVIEYGIEHGFKQINLGRTATEIKSTYGARAAENHFSFYTRNVLLKLVLYVAKRTYVPKEYTLRSPFK
ncbi:MAG TPA: hypothetical protein DCZ98_01780 [Cryomorphaceae bacterium]|nr:hypothetical protein [Cryomorphaceae bacterium]|tara:strand:- start:166 stop:1104 length:939 start_codon:yes stop_codon:yes gene_type:complete